MANGVSSPAGFGGLMRYDEESESKFNLKPTHVIIFVVLVMGFRVLLPFIF
ncbi:MAG TPA: preprotein translocase subunit Sec61beta [Candidatus Nanoarchaeia archaeon]|nr:preprotein translocase subunit Sec61beta [Candidatus Nanoarchaeia archaeon]